MIRRILESRVHELLGHRKAIIIMGARQVGKSTLLQSLFGDDGSVLWLNGDDVDVQALFRDMTSTRLRALLLGYKTVVVDEAQRIADVGLRLKLITDQIPDVQVVATGSSSFELSSKVNEPLTGRKRELRMYPLSFAEMVKHTSLLEELRMIPHRMVFGYYPEVVDSVGQEQAVLRELADSYLYRDILSLDRIAKSEALSRLLKALALQIGNQVSYNELGQLVGMTSKTVERYVDILEKSFIVFRLGSYARNLRNELKSSRKIFFYDLGIRNAVVGNLSQVENRSDVGQLWENFVIVERMKRNAYQDILAQSYFWRTQQQQEIDYLEEVEGKLHAYECKWSTLKQHVKAPTTFTKNYPKAFFEVVTPHNIDEFLLK